MSIHLRIARPVKDLQRAEAQYKLGLGLQELGRFVNHEGFDGVMLGIPDADFHLEFTCCRTHPLAPAPTAEDLLVFYVPEPLLWKSRCNAMLNAGFTETESYNPYWRGLGRTFEDRDGYRVVIQRAAWKNEPAQ
ncbi:VOC family protein [Amphibiibacter pelophylacis]|uniref:VOC family protein n=1 Tax=Amphibiibacter pelophylacis TaxID=1799477 RepID=A0ACC6P1K4_9BURK